jgi:catechol 2,3-dioxygenase-like lactoylglutathione lyase family enzyme
MLADTPAVATIAVKNLQAARRFYEGSLGLKPSGGEQQPGVMMYGSGQSRLLVYESQFAGTNKATAATWMVGDEIESIVKTLKSKGVVFEHYDMPGLTLKGDVHVGGDNMKAAWAKDPDGNVLAFVGG